ncbi:MAG: RING finger domain-containing protein [Candidatus Hodarchaeales archaeon]|jgi:hypothetical protein
MELTHPDVGKWERKICTICRQPIEEEKKLIICPYCTSTYHQEHLMEWLTQKSACPVCDTTLTGYDIGVPLEKKTLQSIHRQDALTRVFSHPKYQSRGENIPQETTKNEMKAELQSLILILLGVTFFVWITDPNILVIVTGLILTIFISFFYILKTQLQKRYQDFLFNDDS